MDVEDSIIQPPSPFVINGDNVGDRFRQYRKYFELYIRANAYDSLSGSEQIALLRNFCGVDLGYLIENFDCTEDTSLHDVLQYLEDYFCPSSSVLESNFKFNCRRQQPGETFDKFLIEVKKMARKCDFGSFENNAIKMKLIHNIHDYKSRKQFMSRLENNSLEEVLPELRSYFKSPHHLNQLQQWHLKRVRSNVQENQNVSGKRPYNKQSRGNSRQNSPYRPPYQDTGSSYTSFQSPPPLRSRSPEREPRQQFLDEPADSCCCC